MHLLSARILIDSHVRTPHQRRRPRVLAGAITATPTKEFDTDSHRHQRRPPRSATTHLSAMHGLPDHASDARISDRHPPTFCARSSANSDATRHQRAPSARGIRI
ncbi:hypothetical protein AVEN_25617-1 [Araneus ventricosus]|uniref:Uncharacterized protein n=1 Tax=Araneus ventricosus TaxID=182803 RepID=A0A4Y2BPI2_ARAVE|nr:hypothetical protein AVEN_25617-1 [Araneus ventricosus]